MADNWLDKHFGTLPLFVALLTRHRYLGTGPIVLDEFQALAEKVSGADKALEHLRFLEKKGYVEIHHDPLTTTEDIIGEITYPISHPWDLRLMAKTGDTAKQAMLDRVFSLMPRQGERYSDEIQLEILRGELNQPLIHNAYQHRVQQSHIGNSLRDENDWPLLMSAIKKWESKGYLKILKNPQTTDSTEYCIQMLKIID